MKLEKRAKEKSYTAMYGGKSLLLVILFLVSAFSISCSTDPVQLSNEQLNGVMDAQEWEYGSANAYVRTTDLQYLVRFLSAEEGVSDPCAVPSPGLKHVKAIFRPDIGSFTVSAQALNNNQVQVAFEVSPSRSLVASGGFMEIYDISNAVVIGYLQAILDDDNKVEGNFQIRLCN